MLKKYFPVTILIFVLLLSGCIPKFSISPSPIEGQKVFYSKGVEAFASLKKNLVVIRAIEPTFERNKRIEFFVFFKNLSSSPINFSSDNITATVNGKMVGVCTYQQLVDEIERRRGSRHFSNTLASALNTKAAVDNGSYYDPNIGQVTQMILKEKSSTRSDEINDHADHSLHLLQSTALRKQTVFPNQHHGGVIKFEKYKLRTSSNLLLIRVFIDGEVHSFNFALNKVNRKYR